MRLIDAEALKKEELDDYVDNALFELSDVIALIDNAPTVERQKGTWFVDPHSMIMKCMECGHIENTKEVGVVNEDKHFCYWCGADMRGDNNDKSSN